MSRYRHHITARLTPEQYQTLRRMPGDSDGERLRALLEAQAARATTTTEGDTEQIADAVAAKLRASGHDEVQEIADAVAYRVGEDLATKVQHVIQEVSKISHYLAKMHHYLAGGGGNAPRK